MPTESGEPVDANDSITQALEETALTTRVLYFNYQMFVLFCSCLIVVRSPVLFCSSTWHNWSLCPLEVDPVWKLIQYFTLVHVWFFLLKMGFYGFTVEKEWEQDRIIVLLSDYCIIGCAWISLTESILGCCQGSLGYPTISGICVNLFAFCCSKAALTQVLVWPTAYRRVLSDGGITMAIADADLMVCATWCADITILICSCIAMNAVAYWRTSTSTNFFCKAVDPRTTCNIEEASPLVACVVCFCSKPSGRIFRCVAANNCPSAMCGNCVVQWITADSGCSHKTLCLHRDLSLSLQFRCVSCTEISALAFNALSKQEKQVVYARLEVTKTLIDLHLIQTESSDSESDSD